MSNIAGALYTELLKSQTKWSAAREWSHCHASVSSNSHVFKRLRKERSDGASLTAGGRLFQARAAATGNARSPSIERLVDLTTRVGESADQSWRRVPTVEVSWMSSVRYDGAMPCRHGRPTHITWTWRTPGRAASEGPGAMGWCGWKV